MVMAQVNSRNALLEEMRHKFSVRLQVNYNSIFLGTSDHNYLMLIELESRGKQSVGEPCIKRNP